MSWGEFLMVQMKRYQSYLILLINLKVKVAMGSDAGFVSSIWMRLNFDIAI